MATMARATVRSGVRRSTTPAAPSEAAPARRPRRWARWTAPVLALTLAAIALATLRRELHAYSYRDISRSVRALPPAHLALALALTACAYVVLAGYDFLALRYAVRDPARRVTSRLAALTSFVAYGLSQTIGWSALTGASVRYR